jgi:hypothetical protein
MEVACLGPLYLQYRKFSTFPLCFIAHQTLVTLLLIVLTVSIRDIKVKVKKCVMNKFSEQLVAVILLIISSYFSISYCQIFLICI